MLLAAHVGSAHGLKGEVALNVQLEDPSVIKKLGVLFLEDGTPFSIDSWRMTAKGPLVKFAHISERTGAEKLRGVALFIHRKDLPPLKEDEIYYADLKGLKVFGVDGKKEGHVADIFSNGAQDILVVQTYEGAEVLVPYTHEAIHHIDIKEQTLKLTPFGINFLTL